MSDLYRFAICPMSAPHDRFYLVERNDMRITKTRLRTIVKNARCKDCGTNSPEAMSIVNDDIMCANCAKVRLFG